MEAKEKFKTKDRAIKILKELKPVKSKHKIKYDGAIFNCSTIERRDRLFDELTQKSKIDKVDPPEII